MHNTPVTPRKPRTGDSNSRHPHHHYHHDPHRNNGGLTSPSSIQAPPHVIRQSDKGMIDQNLASAAPPHGRQQSGSESGVGVGGNYQVSRVKSDFGVAPDSARIQPHYGSHSSGGMGQFSQPYYSTPLPKHGQPMSQCNNAFQSQARWSYDMSQGYQHQHYAQLPQPQNCLYDRHQPFPHQNQASQSPWSPQLGRHPRPVENLRSQVQDNSYPCEGYYGGQYYLTSNDLPLLQEATPPPSSHSQDHGNPRKMGANTTAAEPSCENKMIDDLKTGELDSSKFDMPLTPYSNNPPTPSHQTDHQPPTPLPSFQATTGGGGSASTPYHEANYPPTPAYSDLQSPNSETHLHSSSSTSSYIGSKTLPSSMSNEDPTPFSQLEESQDESHSHTVSSANENQDEEIFVPLHELIGSTLGSSSSSSSCSSSCESSLLTQTNQALPQEKQTHAHKDHRSETAADEGMNDADNFMIMRVPGEEMSDTLEMALNDMTIALRNTESQYLSRKSVAILAESDPECSAKPMVRLEFQADCKSPVRVSSPSSPSKGLSSPKDDDDKNRVVPIAAALLTPACSSGSLAQRPDSLGGRRENDTVADGDKVDLSNFMRLPSQQSQDDDSRQENIKLPFKRQDHQDLEKQLKTDIIQLIQRRFSAASSMKGLRILVEVKTLVGIQTEEAEDLPSSPLSSSHKGIPCLRKRRFNQGDSILKSKTNDRDSSKRLNFGEWAPKSKELFSLSIAHDLDTGLGSEPSMSDDDDHCLDVSMPSCHLGWRPSGQNPTTQGNTPPASHYQQQHPKPTVTDLQIPKPTQTQATIPVQDEPVKFTSGASSSWRNPSPGHDNYYHCTVCLTSFPLSLETMEDVCQHVATGIVRPNAGHSAIFLHFQQKVKLIVNNHKGVSISTALECLKCDREFLLGSNPNVVSECFRHLIGHHYTPALESFCVFCDQKIASGLMEQHMNDPGLRSQHFQRLQAVLTCFCSKEMNHRRRRGGGDPLSIAVHDKLSGPKNAIYTPSKPDDSCCQICQRHFEPHPALPKWLSTHTCLTCAENTIANVSRATKKCVVLCHFCKQGKYGYKSGTRSPSAPLLKETPKFDGRDRVPSSPSGAVCVNCLSILDVFTVSRQKNSRECFNYVQGMLTELLSRLSRHSSFSSSESCSGPELVGRNHPSCGVVPSSINHHLQHHQAQARRKSLPKPSSPKKQVAIVPPEPRSGSTASTTPSSSGTKCSIQPVSNPTATNDNSSNHRPGEHLTSDKITSPMDKVLECSNNNNNSIIISNEVGSPTKPTNVEDDVIPMKTFS
ncbi:hypothetical protein TCAL_05517 [Tigriopus californicus]|uniref:Uncharacterized protein n=1 Tax=Tigriopus californicus TaxID=6832 RepID=A0A553NQ65_TIGCA|nr:hypothetical protein TCAL_05517 [Tigriopus californicus]|eukprot:TCALIF_05517-PA protein Name:"Protein of unknown function" AED:0.24 eAED:0.24 QI:0/0.33/0.25/0.5/1/1/4/7/1290